MEFDYINGEKYVWIVGERYFNIHNVFVKYDRIIDTLKSNNSSCTLSCVDSDEKYLFSLHFSKIFDNRNVRAYLAEHNPEYLI